MGKGIAGEVKRLWPGTAFELAKGLIRYGNIPHYLGSVNKFKAWNMTPAIGDTKLYSFPTKEHWKHKSIPDLIVKSATWFKKNFKDFDDVEIVLPRIGCGEGGLEWPFVKSLIAPILDDRFTIVSLGGD